MPSSPNFVMRTSMSEAPLKLTEPFSVSPFDLEVWWTTMMFALKTAARELKALM